MDKILENSVPILDHSLSVFFNPTFKQKWNHRKLSMNHHKMKLWLEDMSDTILNSINQKRQIFHMILQ